MHWIDYLIFILYFLAMLGVGVFFYRNNKDNDDYYVGGRNIGSWHVGLSVVATDVGGGFSIGLGGLGFVMGLSGSWMLFTGLIGAWLAAVFLIPKISKLGRLKNLLTFPQIFQHYYDQKVAVTAGVISAIGYIGFTSSQLLAGAKLASATFTELNLTTALVIMGVVAVGYTVVGGLKAVIYTDTVQWIILMAGLIFIGLPLAYVAVGGFEGVSVTVGDEFLSLTNVGWVTLFNWFITIVPIWFVGMTLYQRIYACKDEKSAQKAWFIAGLFEYPIMAFMGVALGLFARVAADMGMFEASGYMSSVGMDAEMGLPVLLRTILPIGLTGLMLSAYFSAIMSTADSCLMAASGNVVTDILRRSERDDGAKDSIQSSQWVTLVIGVLALALAMYMQSVLELMLLSYAFMVSGLLVPVACILLGIRGSARGAFFSMIGGGLTTVILAYMGIKLPSGLDPNVAGITVAFLLFFIFRGPLENGKESQVKIEKR